ncbi:MAG: thioredoxin family protein [candidate division Zixibacteria bacterium]|nr:thioredoxin family protein [candidate division Zixibacteria bacterium]
MPVLAQERFATGFQWAGYMQNSQKNLERFHENYDRFRLTDHDAAFFASYTHPVNVLILAEDWCGDVVQQLPPIVRMIERAPGIEYRIFRRDEHPDLMDRYLTDGARSIPYTVFMDADLNETAQWGPRPGPCQAIMRDSKSKMPMEEIYPLIRTWYKDNVHGILIREIRGILERLKKG